MTLVAAYSFDSGAVVDNTGRGHDGTLFNVPTFPAGHSKIGLGCASASSQYAEIADHADFTLGTAWTIMCWVNPTTLLVGGSEMVCKKNQWWFSFDSGNWQHGFYKSIGGTKSVAAGSALTVGIWQHVACRYNGLDLQLVLNGTQVATALPQEAFTMIDNTELVRMGSWDGASEFLNGVIDDARVFNNYLNDADIAAYMNTPVADPTAADNASFPIGGWGAC